MKTVRRLTAITLAVGLSLGSLPAVYSAETPLTARELDMLKRMDQLASELEHLRDEIKELKKQNPPAQPLTAAKPVNPTPATGALANGSLVAKDNKEAEVVVVGEPSVSSTTTVVAVQPATILTSYGEINYHKYDNDSHRNRADLRRLVLGFQHRFNAKNKVVAEVEVEHSVVSKEDDGEVAVEQAYIEHLFNPTWSAKAGLFLMPVGLLNENHEPTAYYGVERNFVETYIIPTTWREGGIQAIGAFNNGLLLQAGISTSFDINKWDFGADSESAYQPLKSVSQELQLARAHDLGVFASLNWRGIPGLLLGGSIFAGDSSQGARGRPNVRVTLWDLHARYTPGNWDLAALVAQGHFSNTAAYNRLPEALGADTLVPSRYRGWYLQGAYKIWQFGDYSLVPFARYERFNPAAAFAYIGQGLTPRADKTIGVWTFGANFNIGEGIVLKADWQRFNHVKKEQREKNDQLHNRFDVGLGWSF